MTERKTLLCPVDFSGASEGAVRYAVDLATRLDADVELLHVYQLPTYALPDGAILARPQFVADLTTDLQKQLDGMVHRYSGHDVKVTGVLSEGAPFAEINRVANEHGAYMIVMGTHGRTGLKHLLIGSVAERVVRTAEVPVLTVPLAQHHA